MSSDDQHLLQFYINLTERQRDVMKLTVAGLTNREIGQELCIESPSVAEHLTNIYAELDNAEWTENGRAHKRYALIRLFSGFFSRYDV